MAAKSTEKCFQMLLVSILLIWATWITLDITDNDVNKMVQKRLLLPLRSFSLLLNVVEKPKENKSFCYEENNSTIIFFYMTNETKNWSSVEMCAFRSAALLNNDTGICILTSVPMEPHPKLDSLPNLRIERLNISRIIENTFFETWYESNIANDKQPNKYLYRELSDALRYAYLYKYGGKYMDTDSWTLKNLAPLNNVAAWQGGELIANGVMFFDKGHPFLGAILASFTKRFAGGSLDSLGPYLVTAVHKSGVVDNSTYTILPNWYFYPTHYSENHFPFQPHFKRHLIEATKNSYTIHMWGFMIKQFWTGYEQPPNGSYYEYFMDTICA